MENERCAVIYTDSESDSYYRFRITCPIAVIGARQSQTETDVFNFGSVACKASICVINDGRESYKSPAAAAAIINGFLRSRAHTPKMLN